MKPPRDTVPAATAVRTQSGTGGVLAEASGLAAGYGGRAAIEEVSFRVSRGQRIGLLGPNGGGKTTLLRAMLGDLAPLRGVLRVSARCGVVPQTERSRLDYPVSALDVALMGSLSHLPWWRRPGRAERHAALDALGAVGLRELADTTFGELSGGQRQRVLVARGLVQEAGLLLLDEPFGGLDSDSAQRLEDLIGRLAGEGIGVIVATHDLEQARRFDLVLCLNRRQIAFGEPDAVLDLEVLEATYRGAIVEVPGDGGRGILPPHHHDHDHG
jgi:ABC-type Mn2+/Zn2+ transport system ATPase subunit